MPYLYFTLVDPELLPYLNDILPTIQVGGCNLFNAQYLPVLGTNYINVERSEIDDRRNALHWNSTKCSVNQKNYTRYASYRFTVNHLDDTNLSRCDVDSKGYSGGPDETCMSSNHIGFSTNMVSQQTSKRKTNWKKILTDEGSIAGGIMFFTWFLGIFVL